MMATEKYTGEIIKKSDQDSIQIKDVVNLRLDDRIYQFPIVWLRDNCQCDECYSVETTSRIILFKNFNIDQKPERLKVDQVAKNVEIEWEDGHVTHFTFSWLKYRSFELSDREKYTNSYYKLPRVYWTTNDFKDIFKKFDYNEVMHSEQALFDYLCNLSTYGVALVENVPESHNSCRNLAAKFDFWKKTHYGEEFFVTSRPDASNQAYVPATLQFHTDLPYYEYKPCVNLLHFVTQSDDGGENILTDGLYVANYLRHNEPDAYEILSKTCVQWEDFGTENGSIFHPMYRSPVICENFEGIITKINYSIPQRGSHFNLPVEKVKPWYKALKRFSDLLYENASYFKVSPGTMLTFDNTRLVHGRSEYKSTEGQDKTKERYVIGLYVDWDAIDSRIRILSKNLHLQDH